MDRKSMTRIQKHRASLFMYALKACAQKQDLYQLSRIHAEICKSGLLHKDTYLANTLVSKYAKCGSVTKARKVFDDLPVRDVVSWAALIAGYAQLGFGKVALDCYHQMQSEGLFPSAIIYASTLKACGILQDLDMGEKIHDEIATQELLKRDIVIGNTLVDMYAKCGSLTKARKVFEELPVRDVVSWGTLIAGYAQHGFGKEALCLFEQMRSEGLPPSANTYACTLKACGISQDLDMGEKIHNEIATQGLLKKNVVVGTALVDMYAKCGSLTKAHKVLDELPVRNVVSWGALIAGYAQHGFGKEALGHFEQMRCEGFSPNATTYACALKACGILQDLDMGEKIHDEIATQGILYKDVVIGTALADMYAKCGSLTKARKTFEELPVLDAVSWRAFLCRMLSLGVH